MKDLADAPEVANLDKSEMVADLYQDSVPEVTTFRPMRDMVLAEYVEEDLNRKVGSLFMPTSKKSANQLYVTAIVKAVGGKCEYVKAGATIMIGEHHGDYYKINNKRHVLIRERDISGIVT